MGFMDDIRHGRTLIADGAMGTLLQAAGLPAGTMPEEWNLHAPARIEAAHRAYLEAGAHIILTNTFGANRLKLTRAGQANFLSAFNRAAVEIAKRATQGFSAYVAGDLGPTGELMHPMGELTLEKAREVYAEQARILAEVGVDLFVIETMSDLDEAQAAILGVQDVTSLPIVATMSFDTRGRTMMGVRPEQMMERLWPLGLAAIGANCGKSLEENLEALEKMRIANPSARLWIKPNAGLPRLVDDHVVYDKTPEQFAEFARRFEQAGARVIGGCCGTTPAHIAAVARAASHA